jgi:hypothetical protein
MKRHILPAIFFLGVSGTALASERADFGFRTSAGAIGGINNTWVPEVSFWGDFYFLSPDFRMLFGFNLFDPPGEQLPWMDLQAIGVEYNLAVPYTQRQRFLFGARYNKTYMQAERDNYQPRRGMSYHLGYKIPIQSFQDIVIEVGQQYVPVRQKTPDPTFSMSTSTFFARAGWEIYF